MENRFGFDLIGPELESSPESILELSHVYTLVPSSIPDL